MCPELNGEGASSSDSAGTRNSQLESAFKGEDSLSSRTVNAAINRISVWMLCLGGMITLPAPIWSQKEDAKAEKMQALQMQLDTLKAQVRNLQAQLDELTSSTRAANAAGAASSTSAAKVSPTVIEAGPSPQDQISAVQALQQYNAPSRQSIGDATATYQTNSQDQIAAPRIDNAPLDPQYPGYFRLPGTLTMLRIGGYFKTDFIYDLKPAGNPELFIPSSFPIPTPAGVNNTTVSIRPTRINLDFLVPFKTSSARFFVEFDFFGSDAATPRLRHAYAQSRNILIGQSFSTFADADASPDTLDAEGPNSQIIIRNPQLRYSIPLGQKTSLSFSVEKATSDVAFQTPQFSALPNSPTPDGAINLRREFKAGHVQISTVMRSPAAYLSDGRSDSVFGWGASLTGSLKILGSNTFVYQGAYGAGYESYVNDTSGLGIDAAPDGHQHLKALPLTAIYGGIQHYWVGQLRSSAIYGFDQVQNTSPQSGSTFHKSDYATANLIWNPFGSFNSGTEFLYGWVANKDNFKANAPRFMFSAKYNFIKESETKK